MSECSGTSTTVEDDNLVYKSFSQKCDIKSACFLILPKPAGILRDVAVCHENVTQLARVRRAL